MILFLKIDTSGLIRRDLPLRDPLQPWAVKVAAELTDASGERLNAIDLLIKADGRSIKPKAQEVHGIDARQAEQIGVKEAYALAILADLAGKASVAVSYAAFDTVVIDSLLLRMAVSHGKHEEIYLRRWRRPGLAFLNLQAPACQVACAIPDTETEEYRWPTLDEACGRLLGEEEPNEDHTVWRELERARRLYFHLREKGHFEDAAP